MSKMMTMMPVQRKTLRFDKSLDVPILDCFTDFRIRRQLQTKLRSKQADVIPKKLRFWIQRYHDHLKKLSNYFFRDHFSWQLKKIMLSRHAERLNGLKDWLCPTVLWYRISSLEPRIVLPTLFFQFEWQLLAKTYQKVFDMERASKCEKCRSWISLSSFASEATNTTEFLWIKCLRWPCQFGLSCGLP